MADGPGPSLEQQPTLGDVLRQLNDARRAALSFRTGGREASSDVQQEITSMITRQFGTTRISNGLLEVAEQLPALVKQRAESVVSPKDVRLKDGRHVRLSDSSIITERVFPPIAPALTSVVKGRFGFGSRVKVHPSNLSEDVERTLIQMTPGHTVLQEKIKGQREIQVFSSRIPRSLEWVIRLIHLEPHEVKALAPTPEELALIAEQELYGLGHADGMFTGEDLTKEAMRIAAEEEERKQAHLAALAEARRQGEQTGADATRADHERIQAAARDFLRLTPHVQNGVVNGNGAEHKG